jgi:hypothetical protein
MRGQKVDRLGWGADGAIILDILNLIGRFFKTPAAAFQTLLGLGTVRESTEYEQIRGAKDLKSQPLEAC